MPPPDRLAPLPQPAHRAFMPFPDRQALMPQPLYNHIQLSNNLISGCDYSLFKDGIEPMWEVERNKRGGRWLITLSKLQRRTDLDRLCRGGSSLLCLVGEAFDDHSDDVCGAVVNIRTKGDKLVIWTTV
ncbi:eukaryotic translation initiation factor 4E-1A-like [Salvelinus namaycush]|uniref:Eukaryotic translation initiation factor 4E-1A-like n=1 Tax=Salvelinus namaycush TaxID=8040 RepID=A0A8U1H2L2_SALNM|nr:eukaryotic translation initiation factor 4E-1A-like [Salvelinus namaycush]